MQRPQAGLTLFNAQEEAGRPSSLRIADTRIVQTGGTPQCGDLRIDLRGDRLLPGLINAHDHLQLNALPRLKYRARYTNASQWIADIEPRRQSDPQLRANGEVPREQRLLIGGIKNLLSGVTTVAHHDPLYASVNETGFPLRVLTQYGWSHSLALDGAQAVQSSQRRTPAHWPWIIHAAEGSDAAASAEFEQLQALGCLSDRTLLVHGVALSELQQHALVEAGAGLIWCPTSNLHLFDRTPDIRYLFEHRRVALGSDSRISGDRDLLAELRCARDISGLDDSALESLVTERAAELLRLPDRGRLEVGALADLIVLPESLPLSQARRADIRLLLIGGVPRYADPDYVEIAGNLAELADLVPVQVDGRPKYLDRALVAALSATSLREPGLLTSPSLLEPMA